MRTALICILFFSSLSFADSCEDSDGGNNPKVKGTTLMTVGPASQQFISREKDSCKDQKHLIEYYCKDNHSVTMIVACPKNCAEGVCL